MSILFKTILFFTVFTVTYSARILEVYPVPSISHQIVFRALTLELVERGHEVVVITTDPVFKNKTTPKNLTEIDISNSYELLLTMLSNQNITSIVKRGVIMDPTAMILGGTAKDSPFLKVMHMIFNYTEVNQLIEDKNQKFDLIIIEGLSYVPLIISRIFNAPAILFSSLYGLPANYETVGSVARHPIMHPNVFSDQKISKNLGMFSKIKHLYVEYKYWRFEQETKEEENRFLKSRFGSDAPTIDELAKNVVLLFVNSHPIFDGNRAVSPATVYLGAVHLQPSKKLPEDLKSYLDNSSRGVIYVSLGTNVRPSFMTKDFLDAFLDAFEQIPYDILWKFDGDSLVKTPDNVKIQKWFPQRDLLNHPNVKLFVMQGGLQSTDEAIDAEVPLVGIPMLADQWYNTNKYEELGIGVQLDSYTMVAEDLVKAVNFVVNNPSYKENIKNLKLIMKDQPEKSIERAVWWIEHVLRHKGSRHLIGPLAKISLYEYFMLDVLIPVAVALTFIVALTVIALLHLFKFIFRKNPIKIKQN